VLTINQVFEILIRWVETSDWKQALYSVVPKRKFQGSGPRNDKDVGRKQVEVWEEGTEEQDHDAADVEVIDAMASGQTGISHKTSTEAPGANHAENITASDRPIISKVQ
jgi:tRNA (guanine9-N1)-methyltransferase